MNATLSWDERLAIVKRQLASAPAEIDEILHDLYMAGFLAGVADCMDMDKDEDEDGEGMSAERFTFTVRGPLFEFGIWHADRDVTECLTGGYNEPATRAEIEELVSAFDGNGPVQWDGLTGWYDESAFDENDESVTHEFTITLTEVIL